MFYLPMSCLLLIFFILLLPLLFFLAQAGILGIAFAKLGLSPGSGVLFFLACLVAGGLNIPIHRKAVVAEPGMRPIRSSVDSSVCGFHASPSGCWP